MATLGLGTMSRSSPGNCFSTPPLKKKVTWAYFSVSATWHCLMSFELRYSASTLPMCCGLKAMLKG